MERREVERIQVENALYLGRDLSFGSTPDKPRWEALKETIPPTVTTLRNEGINVDLADTATEAFGALLLRNGHRTDYSDVGPLHGESLTEGITPPHQYDLFLMEMSCVPGIGFGTNATIYTGHSQDLNVGLQLLQAMEFSGVYVPTILFTPVTERGRRRKLDEDISKMRNPIGIVTHPYSSNVINYIEAPSTE
jgi:hypothetical protein